MPPKSPKDLVSEIGDCDVLALDVGDARVGVARGHTIARLPEPLDVITNDESFIANLSKVIQKYSTQILVVGLPRSLDGQETAQTAKIREFVAKIHQNISLPVVFIEETLTSVDADEYLKNNKNAKFSQDSVAACYILTEFFNQC